VEWGLLLGEQRTIDLVEARQLIEVDIAGLAARRRTEEDLDDLERILARMGQESRDGAKTAAFVDADVEFHLRLAESARNSALRDVLSSIQALLRAWIGRVIAEGYRDISYAEHVPIFEAVRARDARAAEDAMDAHMRSAAGRLQATLDRASGEANVIDPSAAAKSVS
jgi:GntR family transcriptional repressor for pyruvate dehydrogenase complex